MNVQTGCYFCGKSFNSKAIKQWVIWLSTKNPDETVRKIRTFGAVGKKFAQPLTKAQFKVSEPYLSDESCFMEYEKIYVPAARYCPSCKRDARSYYRNLMGRVKKEGRERMKKRTGSDEGQIINPISDTDNKKIMAYQVQELAAKQAQTKEDVHVENKSP